CAHDDYVAKHIRLSLNLSRASRQVSFPALTLINVSRVPQALSHASLPTLSVTSLIDLVRQDLYSPVRDGKAWNGGVFVKPGTDRRHFLQTSTAALTASRLSAAPVEVRTGFIGIGSR